jgi:hypothetical protein
MLKAGSLNNPEEAAARVGRASGARSIAPRSGVCDFCRGLRSRLNSPCCQSARQRFGLPHSKTSRNGSMTFIPQPPLKLNRASARTENLAFCPSGPPIRATRYGISIARKNRPALVALTFSTRTFPLVSTSGLASNVQLPIGCVTFVVL